MSLQLDPPGDLYGRRRPDWRMRLFGAALEGYIRTLRPGRTDRGAPPRGPTARELVVSKRQFEAEDVVSIQLEAPDGQPLPVWQPGCHLHVLLPGGLRRHYSLCGDPADRSSYRIAVRRLPHGGGGSLAAHALREGDSVRVSGPRNGFPFAADRSVLLIAGGIGITPILPMAREAARRGLDWRLVYTGRSRASMPFLDDLSDYEKRVTIRPDDEFGVPDVQDLLRHAVSDSAVYCCGPGPMLEAVRAAFPASPAKALHIERFGTPPIVDGKPFEIQLGLNGPVLHVPADRSALDVLCDARPAAPYSCKQGFCGTCQVRTLAGEIDHRDKRLNPTERAAGLMLPCMSRAAEGERIVLDLPGERAH